MVVNGKINQLLCELKKFIYLFVSESNKPGFVSKIMIVVINLENLLPNFSSDLPKKLF